MASCLRLLIGVLFLVSPITTWAAEPVRLIFDTDMGNDVDDALALGMIHSLQARGACQLLAVTVTKDSELAGPFIDAVNTFYGRGDIPIGVTRSGVTPEPGKFLPLAEQKDGGKYRYPHDLISGKDAPEAVGLLRKILAAQPDKSVTLVQVGFSTNFAQLLDTGRDQHSPLSGKELISRKVKLLSIMAGAFKAIGGNKRFLEYNVVKDIPFAKKLANEWPTRVVYSGFEIGISIPYPAASIERDYKYVVHHPLAEAYRLYNPPPHSRPTWDLTSVLFAVYPDRGGYFKPSPNGTVKVENDGFTAFTATKNGRHQFLIAEREHIIRVSEALVQLSSQPPSRDAR